MLRGAGDLAVAGMPGAQCVDLGAGEVGPFGSGDFGLWIVASGKGRALDPRLSLSGRRGQRSEAGSQSRPPAGGQAAAGVTTTARPATNASLFGRNLGILLKSHVQVAMPASSV